MSLKRVAVLISTLMMATSLASAQELSKEAKIERLLALTNSQATMNQVFEQMKAMIPSMSQMPSTGTPEERTKALELQTRILDLVKARMSWDKLRPQYVKFYSETFSDEEIDGILAFYQSPAGRAMIEKMPKLMPKIMAVCGQNRIRTDPMLIRVLRCPIGSLEALGCAGFLHFIRTGGPPLPTEIDGAIRPPIRYTAQSAPIFNAD
jgi:uncharacterized protein